MEKPKVIDTSALYPLVKKMGKKFADIVKELVILDLTWYEVGNVIVKEVNKGKIKNLEETALIWQEILSAIKTEEVREIKEVAEIAKKDKLTYYDAAYIHTASKMNLKLITEDQELKTKYPKLCITINEL